MGGKAGSKNVEQPDSRTAKKKKKRFQSHRPCEPQKWFHRVSPLRFVGCEM